MRLWMIFISLIACTWCAAAPTTAPSEAVTFSHDVAPIVFEKCASCHHPGEAAPFALLSYDDVKHHARQIVEVTQRRFMPPWLPSEGDFAGARRLSDQELGTFARWVEAGAPPGELSKAPPTPTFTQGWQTGTPDLVLESPAYHLAAEGRDVFRNFVVPMQLDGPRWIASIELRPTNPRATHHARLGVDSSNESIRRDAEDPEPGYAGMAWAQDPEGQLVIWAPGMIARPATPGIAWRIYPKSCLVLHTHMTPTGKPEVVQFRIGIHFAKEPPAINPVMLRIGSCDIDIPAGASHHVVTDSYTLPIDADVHTVFPHAHSLCKELHVIAEQPDGSKVTIISIDHFDENWHDSYVCRSPVRLPRGTKLVSTFAYDNTDANIRNRNHPARRVVYGSNVTDEMADVYLQITAVHADQRAALMENYKRYEMQNQAVGYRKALELYRDDAFLQEALATCYVGLNEPAKAIATLEQRLKTGPKAVYPVVSLGMALLAGGSAELADGQFRQAIAMDGEYPLAWFGLGRALVTQKQWEEAEKAYRRAIELAPGLVDAQLGLADLLIQRGQLDEAARLCTACVNQSPDLANVYLKLADISARQAKFDESLQFFTEARRAAPYTHPPKVLLAVWFNAHGEKDRAVTLLEEARAQSPEHPVPALLLGQLASRKQDYAAARQYFAAAAALAVPDNWPESHKQRFGVLLSSERFRLAQQTGDRELARESLTQWLTYDPENAQLRQISERLEATPGQP
jgi:tetratricopeptide (TPR) repeat protein